MLTTLVLHALLLQAAFKPTPAVADAAGPEGSPDTDQSGGLDLAEIIVHMELDLSKDGANIAAMIKRFDEDGDGQLNAEEYKTWGSTPPAEYAGDLPDLARQMGGKRREFDPNGYDDPELDPMKMWGQSKAKKDCKTTKTKDCYKELGLTTINELKDGELPATETQIKKAYRKISRDLHPDKCKGEKKDCEGKFEDLATGAPAVVGTRAVDCRSQ
jgi:hypothetical protein